MSPGSAPAGRPRGRAVLLLLLAALLFPARHSAGSNARTLAPPRPPVPSPAAPGDAEEEGIAKARALFDRYVALEHAFDPAAADLYSDDAVIRNRRISATGEVRLLSLPAPQYKEILRKAMPIARGRGDLNRYSGTRFLPEGDRVRIVTTRLSVLSGLESPLSLLVGPAPDGAWLIFEELSVSRRPPRAAVPGPSISPEPNTTAR